MFDQAEAERATSDQTAAIRDQAAATREMANLLRAAARAQVLPNATDTPPLSGPEVKVEKKPEAASDKTLLPAVDAKTVTIRKQREIKSTETAARKAKQTEIEDAVFEKLKVRKPKVRNRPECVVVCKADFGLGPKAAMRIWDRLRSRKSRRSKPRKPASRRRTVTV
jgi:hypothetical protein